MLPVGPRWQSRCPTCGRRCAFSAELNKAYCANTECPTSINYGRPPTCPVCGGSGLDPDSDSRPRAGCVACDGEGLEAPA